MATMTRVWDLPTRLFHWSLTAGVAGLAVTGYIGGAIMSWHARIGYAVLALLLFRLLWGVVGGRWSRFSSFVYSPRSMVAYLRGQAHPDHLIGHNPLGAVAVFAMFAVLLAQIGTGLVGDGEIAFTGPLNRFVATSRGLAATWYHKQIGQWLLWTLIALHIAAVLYYLIRKKDNLIRPMIDGDKTLPQPAPASRDGLGTRLFALALLVLCGTGVAWLISLGG
jgi:cytochrome b